MGPIGRPSSPQACTQTGGIRSCRWIRELLGEATGADLMAQGVELRASPNTAAHMLRFVLQP